LVNSSRSTAPSTRGSRTAAGLYSPGELLPVAPRAPPARGAGAAGGRAGGVRPRRLDPEGRRPAEAGMQMTLNPPGQVHEERRRERDGATVVKPGTPPAVRLRVPRRRARGSGCKQHRVVG